MALRLPRTAGPLAAPGGDTVRTSAALANDVLFAQLPQPLTPPRRARRRLEGLLAAAVVIVGTAVPLLQAAANGFASAAFIQPADLQPFQGFGGGVAADGNTIAVATQFAPFVVYVYTNNNGTWTQQVRLTSPTGLTSDRFGSSLALQGNTLVIGAAGANVAYIYTNTNGVWAPTALLAPSGGSGASFAGSAVNGIALQGSSIAVGAPSETTATGHTGAVYVFTNVNGVWTQQQRIVPTDPQIAGFGNSVALQNDTLVIGAPFSVTTSFQGGTALVYGRQNDGWSQLARLDPIDLAPAGLYGFCVSLDGNTIAVGALGSSEATVFVNLSGTWSLQTVILGPPDSDFGTSLKVIGDRLMVTAYDDVASTGFFSGDAFVYARGGSTWTEQPNLYLAPGVNGIPGPGQDLQRFGNFAAMTKAGSQTIFVMASQTYSNPNARQVGAVYTAILH